MKGYFAFIGTNSVRGSRGIYSLKIGPDGAAKTSSVCGAYNTGALALSHNGRTLYAASEGMTFRGLASGGAMAYRVGEEGGLSLLNAYPTMGQRPCHLYVDSKSRLLAANFYGSDMAVFPTAENGSLAPMLPLVHIPALPGGRESLHCVGMAGGCLAAIAYGRRALVLMDMESFEILGEYRSPEDYSPRHFTAGADGRFSYVLMQSPGLVCVISNEPGSGGKLECIQEISVIPPGFNGMYGTSTLKLTPDGSLLLAATRGADTIALLRVDSGTGLLELSEIVMLPGRTPRDFSITPDGRFTVTALQASDEVCIHEIDYATGSLILRDVLKGVPSPAAVALLERA